MFDYLFLIIATVWVNFISDNAKFVRIAITIQMEQKNC